jgi:outer membrane protein
MECALSPRRRVFLSILAVGMLQAAGAPLTCSAQERLPTPAPSAPPAAGLVRLSLDDARQQALAQNKALALAHLNVDSKQHGTSAATKDYLPKVLGSVTYFHFSDPLGSVLTTRRGSTVSATVLNQDTALSTALIAQPITKLIAIHANVQVSRADEQIAQAKLDGASRAILSGVTQAYYGLYGAQRILAALRLQETVVVQAIGPTPAPEARISLIELRQGMAQVQGQVQELTDQMNDLLGLPAGTSLELVDALPASPPVQSAEQAVQLAMTGSPDIREAEQTILKAEAALQVARMSYLPDVNVVGGYANQTGASYIQQNIGYLGVTANYTFWEWGKKQNVTSQRQADLAMAHQNLQVTRDKIALDTRKAFGAFEQAGTVYQLAGEMAQARQDAERTAPNQAAALAAKAATAAAQLEAMKAEIAYRVAHAQLQAAIGNSCLSADLKSAARPSNGLPRIR